MLAHLPTLEIQREISSMKLFICQFCGSERKNHNSWRNHERCCPSNPDRNYKNGMTGKKGSNQFTYAKKHGLPVPKGTMYGKPGSFTGKKHSKASKEIISEKLSLNNKGGRSKWFEVNKIKVQGTWERDIAEVLTEKKIEWIKPSTKKHSFKYKMDNKLRTYTPDFFLVKEKIYLEVKGYWWGNDKEKMKMVLEQHPNINIIFIEKEEYEKIKGGELVW
jgi:hypothetical protein